MTIAKKEVAKPFIITPEIEQVVNDGQRLITYIARNGSTILEPEVTKIIIDAKYKISKQEWSVLDEQEYLINYDKLAKIVYPVTIESINAVIPAILGKKRTLTKAERAVIWYRRYTMLALLILLITQIYYIFGNGLSTNLRSFFEQRQILTVTNKIEKKDPLIQSKFQLLNQKIDANYKLLILWNQAWSLGGHFNDSMPTYTKKKFDLNKKQLLRENQNDKIDKLSLEQSLYQARIVYFGNLLSAEAVLKVLQGYILPLLYGLLGAFIFVLRSLSGEIKSITYNYDCEIKYRLRLTLGALGGMIIGWFLKPEDIQVSASVSSMALAFLMGYNVDVLFTLMDKIIDNLSQNIDKKQNNSPSKIR